MFSICSRAIFLISVCVQAKQNLLTPSVCAPEGSAGSPIPITIDMLKKITSEMVSGKAAAPSSIVVMIRVAGDTGATMFHNLATTIICDGNVQTDWGQTFNVCLTEHAMKILERIVDDLGSIDDSQLSFVAGRGTADAIFVVWRMQVKYLINAVNKQLDMAFMDLEKAYI